MIRNKSFIKAKEYPNTLEDFIRIKKGDYILVDVYHLGRTPITANQVFNGTVKVLVENRVEATINGWAVDIDGDVFIDPMDRMKIHVNHIKELQCK